MREETEFETHQPQQSHQSKAQQDAELERTAKSDEEKKKEFPKTLLLPLGRGD